MTHLLCVPNGPPSSYQNTTHLDTFRTSNTFTRCLIENNFTKIEVLQQKQLQKNWSQLSQAIFSPSIHPLFPLSPMSSTAPFRSCSVAMVFKLCASGDSMERNKAPPQGSCCRGAWGKQQRWWRIAQRPHRKMESYVLHIYIYIYVHMCICIYIYTYNIYIYIMCVCLHEMIMLCTTNGWLASEK